MSRKFYYDIDGEKHGPVTGQELLYLRAGGKIDGKTWVRAENSQTWRPFDSVDLREERKKQASSGIWRQLFRNISPGTLAIMGMVLVILVVLLVVAVSFLWPLLLVLLALALVSRLMKMK